MPLLSRLRVRLPPEWGVDPVPAEKRTLRLYDFAALWMSLGVGLLVLAAGMLLPLYVPGVLDYTGLSLAESLVIAIVGSVIGSALLALAGFAGSRYGVPTMVSLRPVLGLRGSYLPTALNVGQLVGWIAFELMIMAVAARAIWGDFLGSPEATMLFWLLAFTGWCILLAIGGPLVVVRQWIEKFAVWLVLATTVYVTVQIFGRPGLPDFFAAANPNRSLPYALDLVIAMPISWWPLISDYNRFARNTRSGAAGTFLGYTLANSWFYFLGAAMVVVLGAETPVGAMLMLALGPLLLLVILVDETDNAFANIYSTAVSAQNLAPKIRQRVLVLAAGVAGALLGGYLLSLYAADPLLGLGGAYELFLLFIGAFFVPLLGVLVADYFVVRRGTYDAAGFRAGGPRYRWPALISWGAGLATYFAINGAPALGMAGALPWLGASLPSFALSFALHAGLSKLSLLAPRERTSVPPGK